MSNEILTERDGEVTHVTLNRPDDGNGVTNEMAAELTRILTEAGETSHFVTLRGAGADFCTGRAGMGRVPEGRPEALELRHRNEVIFDCYAAFRRSPAPIVGVVQGRALGFGCALAALCDITIAAASAEFQLPEMGHHIMPTMAMSSLIDRVGYKGLLYLTYSTAEIDAGTALAFGLVSQVVPDGELETAADALLGALAKAPLAAVRAVKEYGRAANAIDISKATDFARNMHAAVNTSAAMGR